MDLSTGISKAFYPKNKNKKRPWRISTTWCPWRYLASMATISYGPPWLWPSMTINGLQGQTSSTMEAMDLWGCGGPQPVVAMARHGHGGQGPPWPWPSISLVMGLHPVEVFLGLFPVISQMTLQTMWGPHKQPSIDNLIEKLIDVSIYKCLKQVYQIHSIDSQGLNVTKVIKHERVMIQFPKKILLSSLLCYVVHILNF